MIIYDLNAAPEAIGIEDILVIFKQNNVLLWDSSTGGKIPQYKQEGKTEEVIIVDWNQISEKEKKYYVDTLQDRFR